MGLEDVYITRDFKTNLVKGLKGLGFELGTGTVIAHLDWLSPPRKTVLNMRYGFHKANFNLIA